MIFNGKSAFETSREGRGGAIPGGEGRGAVRDPKAAVREGAFARSMHIDIYVYSI